MASLSQRNATGGWSSYRERAFAGNWPKLQHGESALQCSEGNSNRSAAVGARAVEAHA